MSHAQLFKRVVGGYNIMTPQVVEYRQKGDFVAEVSKGRGFDNERIFGLSIVRMSTQTPDHDLSTMFWSMRDLNTYWKDLTDESPEP